MRGALIRCYHSTGYLEKVLKNYAWVDKIALLSYRFLTVAPIEDNTEEIVKKLDLPNLIYEKGSGIPQHEIFNRGLQLLKDCDSVFISDGDEFILKQDQLQIVKEFQERRATSVICNMYDYAKDYYHILPKRDISEPNRIVAMVNPNAKFVIIREIKENPSRQIFCNVDIHHFGFVGSQEMLNWKYDWETKEEKIDRKVFDKIFDNLLPHTPPKEILEILNE